MKKLQYLWEEINGSFWFIPIVMLLLAVVSSFGFIFLDSQVEYAPGKILKYFFSGSVDSARSILSIIAGAMIGVAGTIFSITLVVLTLASSQLGSRLVRNFMYDKLNQVVLGTYVSSFVYCLLILSTLKQNDDFQFVPAFSVFAALVSAIAGIILLVVFIHHVSMSIQSDKVISNISEAMTKSIRKLFPDEIGQEEVFSPDLESLKKEFAFSQEIRCSKSGYIQSIDNEGLFNLAKDHNCIIILHYRPGNFLVKGMVICEILSEKEISSDLQNNINNDFIIGKVRTPLQDAEFSIHQMVEIASRALSPGVNDPYTAIACIDNLTTVMCYLTGAKFPSSYRYDRIDKLRIIANNNSFAGMLNASFNQIRQFAGNSPSVMIRLMEAMITINSFIVTKDRKNEITQHAEMIMKAAERTFHEPRDLKDLHERYVTFFLS